MLLTSWFHFGVNPINLILSNSADSLPSMWSWTVFLTLLVIVMASSFVLWMLIVRSTTLKKSVELNEWGRSRQMVVRENAMANLPPLLETLTTPPPRASIAITGEKISAVQFHTPAAQATVEKQSTRWHVMLRRIEGNWPPTGLRPRANASSLIDFMPALTSFPSMAPPERFVVFGVDSAAARQLAKSSVMGLLPPDIGFVLLGDQLLLDFSARHFDTIELPRILTISEQLAAHLPIWSDADREHDQ